MKTMEIKGHLREGLGSKEAKGLRREGQVPCVIYGGEQNIHFYADSRELGKLIYTPEVYKINLHLGEKQVTVVVRDAQFHPVQDNILHMDFAEVVAGKPVLVRLPVLLTGQSIGVKNGGVLRRNAKKLLVKGLVDALPDAIEVDITTMKIGTSVKVGDLEIEGVEFMETDNRVVVAIKTSRKAVTTDDEEGEEGEATEGAEEGAAEGAAEE